MANNLNNLSVTFEAFGDSNDATTNSYADWELYMDEPKYSSRSPKDIIVTLPYSNHEYNFSRTRGRYYNTNEVTYTFYWPCPIGFTDTTMNKLMNSKEYSLRKYFWDFYGNIYDDYNFNGVLDNARCTSFETNVNFVERLLTITVKFAGEPHV